jgi:hypothetical protein
VGVGVGAWVAASVGVAGTAGDVEADGCVVPQPMTISPIANAPIPRRSRTRSSSQPSGDELGRRYPLELGACPSEAQGGPVGERDGRMAYLELVTW